MSLRTTDDGRIRQYLLTSSSLHSLGSENKNIEGINIIKEYKDIFSTEKASGSDRKDDKVTEDDVALAVLKTLIEEKKDGAKDEKKKRKWEFETSPHAHFE